MKSKPFKREDKKNKPRSSVKNDNFRKFDKNDKFKKTNSKKSSNTREKTFFKNDEKIDKSHIITWVFSQSVNFNYWFVDIEWREKWYFVYPANSLGALSWDTVEAYVKTFNWREESVITKVIKRADNIFVGTLEVLKNFWFVILDNKSIKNDIYIPKKLLWTAKHKDRVAVKITKWEWKNPEWYIVENIWDKNKPWNDVLSLVLEAGIKPKFPKAVLDESEKVIWSEEGRIDLTKKLTFTIDWEDAKDLDDAITLEKLWNNYKLIVSIADVSEYVIEGSALDKEAFKRWNSTYLADRVIPMLPEKISNDLCSLNPNTKKLTLSCEIVMDEKWTILSSKVYKSIINSSFRLTYKEVQNMLDDEKNSIWKELMFGWIISKNLLDAVIESFKLKQIITKNKKELWVLDFDFPETKLILDSENNPIDIIKYERYESHKIIEEFMILANQVVWKTFSKLPFLYRIHPKPLEDDVETLRKTLNIFWITLPFIEVTPLVIASILEQIKASPKEKLLSRMVLRALSKAIYSDINEGHFGLGLEFYSHFTSPIRRYSDLLIHRIIKEKIDGTLNAKKISYYKYELAEIAKYISNTERKSEKLEYSVRDLFICKYYFDKVGTEFDAIVSWMIPIWFFVELDNSAEWLVTVESIEINNKTRLFEYDDVNMKFIFKNDLSIQVWDKVRVKLTQVDMERRRLNFELCI